MGCCHDFNGIGDDFPAGQRVFHAHMVHGNAVANANDTEFDGCSASHVNAGFNRFHNGVQVDVARDDVVGGIGNTDHRPANFSVSISHGL